MWKIDLKEGQQLFFTSDTHYNHTNICRGSTKWTGDVDRLTRDFDTLTKMNDVIVQNINAVVGQDDILIHLGDWSFGGFESIRAFREKIVCKNIYLVLGNHDHHIENNRENIRELFVDVVYYTRLRIAQKNKHPKQPIKNYDYVLCHFPIVSWDGMNKDVMHLFGHVHLNSAQKMMRGKSMDVGMDGNLLIPYNNHDISKFLAKKPFATNCIPSDHHEKRIESI